MKKKLLLASAFALSAFLSNAQTIVHVNGSSTDNGSLPVVPCAPQTYRVDGYTFPPGTTKICSVKWYDGNFVTLATSTTNSVSLNISHNMSLACTITFGPDGQGCPNSVDVNVSAIQLSVLPMALTTPAFSSVPTAGCPSPVTLSTSLVNDGNHYYTSNSSDYSINWNLPSNWTYATHGLTTTVTPDANSTGNISATLTLAACPYSVTSPVYALSSRPAPSSMGIYVPSGAVCSSNYDYGVDGACGALNYTFTITTGPAGVVFTSNGLQTLTSTSNMANISFPATGGSFTLTVVANLPGGQTSNTVSHTFSYGLPNMGVSISKWAGDVFTANATVYPGATYHWKVGNFTSTGGATHIGEPPCGVNTPVSVYATGACGTTNTATINVNPSCTGGGGPLKIIVSPNPAQGIVKVSLADDGGTVAAAGKTRLVKAARIVDKSGRVVRRWEFGSGMEEASISTGGLTTDMYILQVFDGKKWVHQEIIVR